MKTQLLYRRDPARNLARFYQVSISRDLLGQVVLHREWGRIGQRGLGRLGGLGGRHGQSHCEAFVSFAAAEVALTRLLRQKQHRGYRLLLTP